MVVKMCYSVLPSVLTDRLRGNVNSCVRAAFPVDGTPFGNSITRVLTRGNSICRRPCLTIHLPFHVTGRVPAYFRTVRPTCLPCIRRRGTFRQLANGSNHSALITANANSNGARYFLCPVLRCYCRRHKRSNVGTLVVCPVGTLTASRSGQVTRLVRGDPRLHNGMATNVCINNLRHAPSHAVDRRNVVASRRALLGDPPSVLLAGCGVLSCLLIHPGSTLL